MSLLPSASSRARLRSRLIVVLGLAGLLAAPSWGWASQLHWLPPRLESESGLTVLPKAYYSTDNEFSLGFELFRPFRFPGSGHFERDAELEMEGRVTQKGHLRGTAVGTVYFGQGR